MRDHYQLDKDNKRAREENEAIIERAGCDIGCDFGDVRKQRSVISFDAFDALFRAIKGKKKKKNN